MYLCRFQGNHRWCQIEFVNLILKSATIDLKSTQLRIDPSFPLICSGFRQFWWTTNGQDEQLIRRIDRTRRI